MVKHSNVPRFFNCPQYIIDEVAYALSREEFLVLMFAVRHILGWHDKIESRQAHISLSVFSKGRPTKTGTIMKGTGLGEPALRKALAALVKYGLLLRVDDPNDKGQLKGQLWELPVEYDPDLLAERIAEREISNKKRTEKARAHQPRKSQTGDVAHQGGMSDIGGDVAHQGGGDVAHQAYINTSIDTDKNILAADAADGSSSSLEASSNGLYPCTATDIGALISAWLRWTPQDLLPTFRGRTVEPSKHYANKTIRAYAQVLWERGYRPNDFIDFLRELLSRQKFAPDAYVSNLTSWSFAWVAGRVEGHAVQRRKTVFYTYDAPRIFPMHPKAQSGPAEAEALALWFDGLPHTTTGYIIDLPCRLYTAAEYELLKAGKPLPEEDDES